jgi:hypothetical protein
VSDSHCAFSAVWPVSPAITTIFVALWMAKQSLELWVIAGEGQAAAHPLFAPHSAARNLYEGEASTLNERLAMGQTPTATGGVGLGHGNGGQSSQGGGPIMMI